MPFSRITGAMTRATAPVAAEIMAGRPPTIAMVTAMVNEANRPMAGSTPAMTENEIASGIRARATTSPASTSVRSTFGSDSQAGRREPRSQGAGDSAEEDKTRGTCRARAHPASRRAYGKEWEAGRPATGSASGGPKSGGGGEAIRHGMVRCAAVKGHGGQAAAPGIMGTRTLSSAGIGLRRGIIGPDTGDLAPRQPYPNVRVEIGGCARPWRETRKAPGVSSEHMQIGEVATRTELSLRTIRHYEDTGLVIPSARSQGGFRLYTESDVARLMVIRRMKPLGFTLDEMRALLEATDRLDTGAELPPEEHEELLDRIRGFEQAAQRRVEDLRTQLARAEEFAAALGERLARPPAP